MGTSFTLSFLSTFLGPIMSRNISAKHGWRSFFWLTVALAIFVTLLLVFTFPDNKWHRRSAGHGSQVQSRAGNSEVNSETMVNVPIIGKGRPSKTPFSPVQKPESR